MSARIAIVNGVKTRHTDALLAAGAGLVKLEVIDPGHLSVDLQQRSAAVIRLGGEVLPRFDAALFRRLAPEVDFDYQMLVLREWSRTLSVAVNPIDGMLRAMDKLAIQLRLKKMGLPTPRTWVTPEAGVAESIVRREGMVVAKPLYGSMGEGLQLWRSEAGIHDEIADFLAEHGVVMLQEYIALAGGDARVFVIGDRAVAASRRLPADGDWRTNVSQGGISVALELTDELEQLAVGAVRAAGLAYSGVDLVPVDDGWMVLEVNGAPSFLGLTEATGVDIPRLLIEYLVRQVDEGRDAGPSGKRHSARHRAA